MKTEKEYFLIRRVGAMAVGPGIVNPDIVGITDDEEYAKSRMDIFTKYDKVRFLTRDLTEIVKEIAETYHDRVVFSGMSGGENICGCCKKEVFSLVCIEHDSQDYSKDLWICHDCYTKIATYWKEHHPKKICPI